MPLSYHLLFFLFKIYFIDYAITVVPFFFSPLFPSALYLPSHHHSPTLVHVHGSHNISSLAFPFPMLFLTSPCLICTYHLCFLFPVHFPPFSPCAFPTDNPPCDVYFCESVPVLVVCLVHFCFCFFRFGC